MNWKKITTLILGLITVFSCFGCKKSSGTSSKQNTVKKPVVEKEIGDVDYGTHIFNATETDVKIVDEGKTEYKIVVPEQASSFINRASTEFLYFFNAATGISLDIVKDSEITYTTDSKYFVFGNVSFKEQISHDFDMELLNTSGYVITTQGNSIFVLANGDVGVLNGAYELLYQLIDYRYYSKDLIIFDKNVKDLNLKDFAICDSPDIEYNMASYQSSGYANSAVAHRLRSYIDDEVWMPNGSCHNVFMLLPPETYKSEYPEWYSLDGLQLCYTARGQADKYEAMVAELVEVLKGMCDANPMLNNISVTQRDYATWCTCEGCTPLVNRYQGEASTQMLFINDVAERLENWLNAERNGRKVNLAIFAYHKTEGAPKNPAPELKLRSNVSVWFAPITASYTSSIFDVVNLATYQNFENWSELCESIYLWFYDINFSYYVIPNNTYHCKQDWYKAAKKYGAKYLFNQGVWNGGQSTGFGELKAWLNSKFGWNVHYDYKALLDEYFENYFGPAAATMRQVFERLETNLLIHNANMPGMYAASLHVDYWSKNFLTGILELIEQAYMEISVLQATNKDLYNVYKNHILIESLAYRYLLVELYASNFQSDKSETMIRSFTGDLEYAGIFPEGSL